MNTEQRVAALSANLPTGTQVLAYATTGSRSYNLATPTSDYDLSIVVSDWNRVQQEIVGDDDTKLYSLNGFLTLLNAGRTSEVDFLKSRFLHVPESPYCALFQSLRFPTLEYVKSSLGFAEQSLYNARRETHTGRRFHKEIKTVLRLAIFSARALQDGRGFRAYFTDTESERFFEMLPQIEELVRGTSIPERELLTEIARMSEENDLI